MTVAIRSYRRRIKPSSRRLVYDRSYWPRIGVPQPQGFWPIMSLGANGSLSDISPNYNAASMLGGASLAGSANGLTLSGAGGSTRWAQTVNNFPYFSTGGFSVVLSCAAASLSSTRYALSQLTTGGTSVWYFMYSAGSSKMTCFFYGSNLTSLVDTVNLDTKTHHWVATINGSNATTFYKDGKQIATGSVTSLAFPAASKVYFGSPGNTASNIWNGTIDYAIAFNCCLTANQVAKLYAEQYGMFGSNVIVTPRAAVAGFPWFIGAGMGGFIDG